MSVSRKIAIVTGANKGIGYHTVRNLILRSKSPILVYAAARDTARGTKAVNDILAEAPIAAALKEKSSVLKFIPLDITSSASIQTFKEKIQADHGTNSIDVLINNAGIAFGFGENPAKDIMDVNYWGTKHLTEALIPLIKHDGTGRIVILGSRVGNLNDFSTELSTQFRDKNLTFEQLDGLVNRFLTEHEAGINKEDWPSEPWVPYKVSKVFDTALTRIFARENPDILINSVCPGWVKTDLGGQNAPGTAEEGSGTPVFVALEDLKGVTGEFWGEEKVISW
ncbi:hypothetical protein ABW19_dt0203239 [Dactylella cylindrospora]|nr:hypothetical protein ABW19_dt0203239 [Dactylella cylindrospora]